MIATSRVDTTLSVLVRADVVSETASEGAFGFGEAATLPGVTRESLADVGRSYERRALSLQGITFGSLADLDALLEPWNAEPVARGGLETALVDAFARANKTTLAHALTTHAGAPAPTRFDLETDITLPIADVATMTRLANEWHARGFRAFKVKVGKDRDHDLEALRAVARAHSDARFRLDANGGYTEHDALAMVAALKEHAVPVECFEQPCATEDLDGMAAVCRSATYPVLGDESVRSMADLERAHRHRALTGANLKLMKFGGPLRSFEIGLRAQALGLPLMCGGMVETRVGMTASAHLAVALGNVRYCDLDTAFLLARDPMRGGYTVLGDSPSPNLAIGSEPGLAVDAEY